MARRGGAARPVGLALLLLAPAACSTPLAADPPGSAPSTTPAAPVATAAATPALPPGPDRRGVLPSLARPPATRWMLSAGDIDVGDAADLSFHDPRHPPVIDGWPMVGAIAAGDHWLVGVADAASDRRWLIALDPASGARLATMGLTRGDGPPSSCTDALTGGTIACLYGDSVEILDPAAATALERHRLAAPAHSIHALDGDVLVLGFAADGTAVHLARLGAAGTTTWTTTIDLDEQEAMAIAGSYLPVVQTVPGLVLVGVGTLQLAVDVASGALAWHGFADVLAPGPDGGLVAGARGEPGWGVPARLESLDANAHSTGTVEGLSWWPAAANSGLVPGPIVAEAGDAVVGLGPDGTEAWRVAADAEQQRMPMVRADGVVVLQDTAGTVTAVEPATGRVRWQGDPGTLGWGARGWAALTDGERMVARSPEGVIAVNLTDGQLAWRVPLLAADTQVWELVAVGEGLVAAGERTITAFETGS